MQSITLGKIMTKNVISLSQGDSIQRAYELMLQEDIRHIPVIDHDRRLVGVMSDRDILVDASTGHDNKLRTAELLVSEIMNPDVITANESDSLQHGIQLMLDRKIHSLPIVAQNNNLIGIITTTDILRLMLHAKLSDQN